MNRIIAVIALLISVAFPAGQPAGALDIDGKFLQGGLVFGRVDPRTAVFYNGRSLRVSDTGIFVLGFGRDAPSRVFLELHQPDGAVIRHPLAVAGRSYPLQRIDGLSPEKVEPTGEDLVRIRKESAMVARARLRDDPRTDFTGGFVWPVIGRITGVYGSRRILNGKPQRPHFGVDISAPLGAPVVAPAAGVVSLTHPDMFLSGGTLIIDHGHGLSSSFLHLYKILVRNGQAVTRGEVVAQVGASGRASGAHLDWRMNLFDTRVDPALLVPPMPKGAP
jgi:murein DD-endopeptidase MepM/ murein hydrolase activator NlpD